MPTNPNDVIAEILGQPAAHMRDPVNANYECPFTETICTKRSQKIDGPYPICSVWHGRGNRENMRMMAVCPKRFYQAEFFDDIITHCWPGGVRPKNPQLANEINMPGFGRVDFVIADIDETTGEVADFVSVEMQAVDISGSVEPAYQGIINRQDEVTVSSGINWKNVEKRYISQLITKGFYHHSWQSRIVAVVQTPLYEYFRRSIKFDEIDPASTSTAITFLLYDFQPDPESETGGYTLQFDRAVSTSQSSLMTAAMYQQVPSKQDFCDRIRANLGPTE